MNHHFRLVFVYWMAILLTLAPRAGLCGVDGKADSPPIRKLTLADAVLVALTNNVRLRSAYMDRHLQRLDLELAERNTYLPTDPRLTLSADRWSSYQGSGMGSRQDINVRGDLTATLAIPTGGSFTFFWNNQADRPDAGQKFGYSSDWSLRFVQPLLKGGGIENAAYGVRIARIAEQANLLALRDTLSDTIKGTIAAFRFYKSAERQLVIADMALARSRLARGERDRQRDLRIARQHRVDDAALARARANTT